MEINEDTVKDMSTQRLSNIVLEVLLKAGHKKQPASEINEAIYSLDELKARVKESPE